MSAAAVPRPLIDESPVRRWVRAGLLTGVVDGLWAVVLTLFYGRSVMRMFQGLIAVPLGKTMLDGGLPTAILGVLTHFCVAFAWSGVFLLLVMQLAWLRRTLESRLGMIAVAAVYGPLIWVVMSLVVIPAFTHQPIPITYRWFIQLAGHVLFVGIPIVWGISPEPDAHAMRA